jgi:aspartyl-tRNA synthetase
MDDIIGMIDGLMKKLAKDLLGIDLPTPLPRMTYDEAMERFGHDAPDLRYGMELIDCTDLAAEAEFRVFKAVAEEGGRVRAINAKGAADRYSRKDIDQLTEWVTRDFGAKGLAWFKVDADGKLNSPIAKNFSDSLLAKFAQRLDAAPGDFLLVSADKFDVTCRVLNGLRRKLAAELKLYKPGDMNFSWVVEFPMFEYDGEEKRWVAMHHPFTAPRPQDLGLLSTDPRAARAQAYDLVINGSEAGGGTIRIHDNGVQKQVFGLLGMDEETAQERFGFLLDALRMGAPPHGGIALGIDRIVMLFGGLENIRDCIAFPKTQKATDLMTGAPSIVERRQLQELGIRVGAVHDK